MNKIDPEKIKKLTEEKISYSNFIDEKQKIQKKRNITISLCSLVLITFTLFNTINGVPFAQKKYDTNNKTFIEEKTKSPQNKNFSDGKTHDQKDSSYPFYEPTTKKDNCEEENCEEER